LAKPTKLDCAFLSIVLLTGSFVVSPLAVTALLLLIAQLEERSTDPAAVAAIATELRAAVAAIQCDPIHQLHLPLELELERIVSVRTAAILRNVSTDSIIRHFGPYIVRTGNKVRGIKLKYVLDLAGNVPQLPKPRRKKNPLALPRKRRIGQGSPKRRISSTSELTP
jgi:hypothetical protein